MPGPLRNKRHERFAQELAKGALQRDACVTAGYRGGEAVACRLAKREDVRARVDEILGRAAKRAEVTVADIARQLDEDREFAREKESPAAAVSATMGKAKVLGLIVDRHAGPTGGAIPIRFDLSNLTDEELEYLERIRTRIAIAGGNPGGADAEGG